MLKSIRQLDYVILLCRDVGAMKRFYRDVMKFPVHADLPDWIAFRAGSTLLTLRPRGRSYDGAGPEPGAASVQLAFRVGPNEVESCHQELKAQGISILEAPRDQSWGHRTLYFHDPEDNVLEIYADI